MRNLECVFSCIHILGTLVAGKCLNCKCDKFIFLSHQSAMASQVSSLSEAQLRLFLRLKKSCALIYNSAVLRKEFHISMFHQEQSQKHAFQVC